MADSILNRRIAINELHNIYDENEGVAREEALIKYITDLLNKIDDLDDKISYNASIITG